LDFVLNAAPSVGVGTWTYSGPGNASFVPDANDPNATVTVDAYGTYTFTWTEVNGTCTDDDDVVVNFYEQPIANAGSGGDECDLDFVLNATPSVGVGTWTSSGPGNASFAPNANAPNATVTVDAYGSYDFTWTENNDGCIDQDQVTVNFYENPTANAGSGGDECDLEFVLNATPSIGVGTWTYTGPGNASFAPDANAPNATVTVDAYGSYDFTWTEDNNGCIDSDQITVNFYEQPVADAGVGGSVCGLDFGLSATPSVGTGTWTYSGPGNASFAPDANDPNATATVDAYGTYTFTWTEVNGTCSDDDNVVVDFLQSPIAFAGIDTLLCYDTDYTILDADTSNCSGLSWSTEGDGTFDDSNILNPTYTPGQGDLTNGYADLVLTAIGNSPCADATDTVRINYLPRLIASIGKPAPFFIDSTSTHIDVYVKMTNHQWLAHVGVYLVSPNDSVIELKHECEVISPIAFVEDATWKFYNDPEDSTSLIPISSCNPTSSGRFLFSGNWKGLHGQDPANGAWKIRVVDYENSGPPGLLEEATIKFSDYNGEGVFESILYADSSINKPIKRFSSVSGPGVTSHTLSITGLTTSCYGLCDATAVGTASGGQPPYVSYEWSDVPDFSNIIATTDTVDLCAGTFYLRITDSHGCTAIDSVTVGQPPEIIIDSDTVVHNICYGDSLGKIALAFSGGTGTLQYTINGTDWYNSGDTIENLGAGDYLVTIIDANQCTKDTLITINEPTPIVITTNVTPISCYGNDDGEIEIIASGGTPGVITPYTYSIDSASTWDPNNIFAPLSPDTFYIAVQDSLGCLQYGDTVYMNNPDSIAIDSVDVTHVACDGSTTDGEIVVYAHGGTGDLEYSINNGVDYFSDSLFTGLNGGDYQIVVRDENGCTKLLDTLVTINGPIIITDETIVHNSCYGYADGEITLTFTGGTGLLQYSVNGMDWFNSGETIGNLPADNYNVIIQDATGCSINYEITINQPDPINIVTSYTDITCNGYADGEIQITATEGTSPYEYSIDSGQTWHSNDIFPGLTTDTFYVAVKDNNGCIQFGDTIVIHEAEPLIISVVDIVDEYQCPNSSKRDVNQTGLISVEVSGGKGDYQYTWQYGLNPVSGDETIHNLLAGTYELTVEDSLGCQKDTTFTVGSDTSYDLEFSVDIEDTTICWYQPIHFSFNSTNADSIEIQKYRPVSSYSYIEITDETMEYDYLITENNYFNLKAFNEYCEEDYITEEFKYFPDRELSIVENDDNENDTIIIKGDNGRWDALAYVNNPTGLDVEWLPNDGVSNPDSLNTIISPAESMWYAVTIITVEGRCRDSDSIYVTYVPDIVTYDGFSPNGDGINDFWYIENINAFKNNIVTVYNRWGTKVYEQKGYNNNDPNKRWDGTAKNGKPVGSGTYYYVIILNEEGFSSVTGAVTIMR
jgi:gliding motility-associated-like protein